MSEILHFKSVDTVGSSGNPASALFLMAQRDFITTTTMLTPLTAGSPRRLQQITPLTGSRSRELCSEKLVTETFLFIPPNVHSPQRDKRVFFGCASTELSTPLYSRIVKWILYFIISKWVSNKKIQLFFVFSYPVSPYSMFYVASHSY